MQCPKCGSDVTKEQRECPICFAPLDAQAGSAPVGLATPRLRTQGEDRDLSPGIPGLNRPPEDEGPRPNYLNADTPTQSSGGLGGGAVRVSLTGEVIEGPPPSVAGAPGPYSAQPLRRPTAPGQGAVPPGPHAPGRGPAPARGPITAHRETEAPAGGKSKVLGTVIALLVLFVVIAGAGAYWFLFLRTNPRDQALKAYTAVTRADWRTLYTVVALSPKDRAENPNAEVFAQKIDAEINKSPMGSMARQILGSFSDMKAGEPVKTSGGTDVPLTARLTMGNNSVTFSGTAHMVNELGIWKLDGRSVEGSKLIVDLIGKPQGGLPGAAGMLR